MANAVAAVKVDVKVAATAIAAMVAVASAVNVAVSATSLKPLSVVVNARPTVRRQRLAPKGAAVDAVTVRRTAARPKPVPSCRAVVARRASAAPHPKWPRWLSRTCNPGSRTLRPRHRKARALRPRPSAKAAAAAAVAVVAVTAMKPAWVKTVSKPKRVMLPLR